MTKRLLENEFCEEKWQDMEPTCSGRHCASCSLNIEDLSEVPINELVAHHLGKNKCVRLTETQIEFLSFYTNFRKTVIASSLVLSASFGNYSHAQSPTDSCVVKGTAMYGENYGPYSNMRIYITAADHVYETQTDSEGNFTLIIPKDCRIIHSNIRKLKGKKIRNRSTLDVRTTKIHGERTRVGFI